MMKQKRKFKAGIVVFCVAAFALLAAVGALILRSDWRFAISQQASALFRNIEFRQVNFSPEQLETIELSDLMNRKDVQFGQSLVLVNAEHPTGNMTFSLEEYKDTGLLMNTCALQSYSELSAAVLEQTGEKLYVNNSYRSREEQEEVFAEEGSTTAAKPGESEHETGLAMDVYVYGLAGPGFIKSSAGQFIASQGWKYGFIVRYPKDKTAKTGISYEPWHIRYVGKPHAQILYNKNWCLEDYFEHLEAGRFYYSGEYLITRQPKDGPVKLPIGITELSVSEDNMGNLVITGKYPKA